MSSLHFANLELIDKTTKMDVWETYMQTRVMLMYNAENIMHSRLTIE